MKKFFLAVWAPIFFTVGARAEMTHSAAITAAAMVGQVPSGRQEATAAAAKDVFQKWKSLMNDKDRSIPVTYSEIAQVLAFASKAKCYIWDSQTNTYQTRFSLIYNVPTQPADLSKVKVQYFDSEAERDEVLFNPAMLANIKNEIRSSDSAPSHFPMASSANGTATYVGFDEQALSTGGPVDGKLVSVIKFKDQDGDEKYLFSVRQGTLSRPVLYPNGQTSWGFKKLSDLKTRAYCF